MEDTIALLGQPHLEPPPSVAFSMLHEGVRRWIWHKEWNGLRDIQEEAIVHLLGSDDDLVIGAATASGKTEAAFLPILSMLAEEKDEHDNGLLTGGFRAVYVSPLKALINDQFRRMGSLCEALDIPVTRWHGDVQAGTKTRARKNPSGVLLVTPESLEAMLVLRGADCARLFRQLGHIVVDELHAFMGNERGCQLRSVLSRIEAMSGRAVRVGLSATLADMEAAAVALRPGGGAHIIATADSGRGLGLSVRGVATTGDEEEDPLAESMSEALSGERTLVFAGSRGNVETLTVALNEAAERAGRPERWMPHHASLSRELRECAEETMRDEATLGGVVCTTTLEMGIDVGSIDSIAQVGPGYSVSGLRQRLGRSGRREGAPSVLRAWTKEARLGPRSHPLDSLRMNTVRLSAMIGLMLQRWNEPALDCRLDFSTALQQCLALVTQNGGLSPARLWEGISASGAFPRLGIDDFKTLLRAMGSHGLIESAPDGMLLLGPEGERITASHEFYAAFPTPVEYRVVEESGRAVGTVPAETPLPPDSLVLLGGRRWRVMACDADRKLIIVQPARGGKPPVFGGGMPSPHARVVDAMRILYMTNDVPVWLDPTAAEFLQEGRNAFRGLGLHERCLLDMGGGERIMLPWVGGRELTALRLALIGAGVQVEENSVALVAMEAEPGQLQRALSAIAEYEAPEGYELASYIERDALERAKYDRFLPEAMLRRDWSAEMMDTSTLPAIAAMLLSI